MTESITAQAYDLRIEEGRRLTLLGPSLLLL
jgi:hypothetical protein